MSDRPGPKKLARISTVQARRPAPKRSAEARSTASAEEREPHDASTETGEPSAPASEREPSEQPDVASTPDAPLSDESKLPGESNLAASPATSEAEDGAPTNEAASTAPATADEPATADDAPESEDASEHEEGRDAIASEGAPSDAQEARSEDSPSEVVEDTAPRITLELFGHTDVGQIREHNEDNFLIADLSEKSRGLEGSTTRNWGVGRGGVLLAVCDGMGGAAAGEVASQMATDIVYSQMIDGAGHGERDRLALNVVRALEVAGSRILAEATTNRACRGMGTTATVAALVDDCLLLGQVGDSRAYILRKNRLVQVTRDQSLVNQLIEAGQLTEEEAENFEHSNIILQALGTADTVQVDLTHVRLRRGDVLMMCSDGLSGMIRDGDIREVLLESPDPAEACRVLIEEANLAGGHDNISVIVARFDGPGLTDPTDEDVASLKYSKYHIATTADAASEDGVKRRAANFDDTPTIEVHGEYELEGDIDWEQLLYDRRLMPSDARDEGSRTWLWAVLVGALLLAYLYFLR